MFKRVLIANRGEIATRIARTLREMSVTSIAVYSDIDRAAAHVKAADEAYAIGEADPRHSYLDIERIVGAARATGAEALHPGYGFLSENPELPAACEAAGIAFIGPSAAAVRRLGDKLSARQHAAAHGLPVTPGGSVDDLESAVKLGESLGYPIFIKPAAGGGGKGMRRVNSARELEAQFPRAKSESENIFGDGTLYLEKAIEHARHVEIQVLCDGHGGGVHLFERDCSIQRRHQKIIEETPAPGVDRAEIDRLGKLCVDAARAAGYTSAGTFEFLLAPNGQFYFLEVNTRLQVEHPITELVVGVDLVREMVRIAAGERLAWEQGDLRQNGAALECRIYAERPAEDFLPSAGTVEALSFPSGPGIRVDSGIERGSIVSSYYDPLLAKLSAWSRDRTTLIGRVSRALEECSLLGVETNLALLGAIIRSPEFADARYATETLSLQLEQLLGRGRDLGPELRAAIAVATELDRRRTAPAASPTSPWVSSHRSRVLRRSGV
jgi:acetyl-CoA carboxylase, biotin carboxylase subunit